MSVAHALPEPATTPAVPVERDLFRAAMARLGAAVNIVTTDGPAGPAGFTATAVCSVSDTPATLLVCLNRGASVHPAFSANGVLCVNVLAAGQQALANLFGGKTAMAERFAAADWTRLATGAPVLAGALVACDCRIAEVQSVGSHDLLLCEVLGVAEPGGKGGLLYFDRRYHELG